MSLRNEGYGCHRKRDWVGKFDNVRFKFGCLNEGRGTAGLHGWLCTLHISRELCLHHGSWEREWFVNFIET